jgi:hypothetical protein
MNLHTSNFTDLKTVGALHSCNSYEDFAKGHQKQAMARIIKFLSPNNKTELAPNRHYDPVGDIPHETILRFGTGNAGGICTWRRNYNRTTGSG